MSMGVKVFSDIVTDYGEAKDGWNKVLGKRANGGFCNLGVES